jgi:formylmethanofuran dehydrogenase subunit B
MRKAIAAENLHRIHRHLHGHVRGVTLGHRGERNTSPMIRRGDKLEPSSFDEAVSKAATILSNAKYPLLFGWSLTSTEATCVGVELCELLGGVIDNNTGFCHGPGLIGCHDIGVSTCTLGEVRHRADLILYWGANPVHAHPVYRAFYGGSRWRR